MPTLNTNGATITDTVTGFEFYTTIRHSAATPLAPVTLTLANGGYLDLSDELNGVAVTLTVNALGNSVVTGNGADTIFTDIGHDEIHAGGGNDFINGGSGNDVLDGGAGDDQIIGGYDNDSIFGGDGNDFLQASAGLMTIDGGAGNDRVIGGTTGSADGGAGYDTYQTTSYDISMLSLSNFEVLETFGYSLTASAAQLSSFSKIIADSETTRIYLNVADAGVVDLTTSAFGRSVDLRGSAFGNTVLTSNGNDYIQVYNLSSTVDTGAGNDIAYGGNGNDRISGGDGDDELAGGKGSDTIKGGAGIDVINGGSGVDTVDYSDKTADIVLQLNSGLWSVALANGAHEDSIFNIENIIGGSGNDTFSGGLADNLIRGGFGNDTIDGGAGFDRLNGEGGDDTIIGGLGYNIIDGGFGNDRLYGGADADTLNGGIGNDTFFVSTGIDTADGGTGADSLDFSGLTNLGVSVDLNTLAYTGYGANLTFRSIEGVTGTNGDDVLKGGRLVSDRISGGAGNDQLIGGGGNDKLNGGTGDDLIDGGDGNDFLDGGTGNDLFIVSRGIDVIHGKSGVDILDFSLFSSVGANLNMTTGEFAVGVEKTTFTGIEGAIGTAGNDTMIGSFTQGTILFGGDGNDTLLGRGGNSTLSGDGGNDTLAGGAGSDVMTGGSGKDTFQFMLNSGVDQLTDFSVIDDTLAILTFAFTNFDGSTVSAGVAAADYVVLSASTTLPGAPGSSHGYVLATSNALYWDNDGSGANAAVQFASINPTTNLTLDDFLFV